MHELVALVLLLAVQQQEEGCSAGLQLQMAAVAGLRSPIPPHCFHSFIFLENVSIEIGTLCRALELAAESDGLLVVGSSLMVYSAFRLAKAARHAGAQVAAVCVGPTRADDFLDLKV